MQGHRVLVTIKPSTRDLINSVRGDVPLATWIAAVARSRAEFIASKRAGRWQPAEQAGQQVAGKSHNKRDKRGVEFDDDSNQDR